MLSHQKNLIISVSILIIACVVGGIIFYSSYHPGWLQRAVSNCIRLRGGAVNIEVNYPDDFIDVSYERGIRIKPRDILDREKPADGDYVLVVNLYDFYESLEEILNTALQGIGPPYEKFTFKGHDAGFARTNIKGEIVSDYYRIPIRGRVLLIMYQTSHLSPKQKILAQKMFDSITIEEVDENAEETRVEDCWGWF